MTQPELSVAESDRFGYRIARATVGVGCSIDPRALDAYDIVIVRSPSEAQMGSELSRMPNFTAIHADTLVYWSHESPQAGQNWVQPESSAVDGERLSEMIREVFAGYTNHYASNPLLSRDAALAGYCEWGTTLVVSGAATAITVDDAGRCVAFAVVDWSREPTDIKLAGVRPGDQRRGWYLVLLRSVLREAELRRCPRVVISTQSHNIAVQRAWIRAGFVPLSSLDTTHLVRTDLLS